MGSEHALRRLCYRSWCNSSRYNEVGCGEVSCSVPQVQAHRRLRREREWGMGNGKPGDCVKSRAEGRARGSAIAMAAAWVMGDAGLAVMIAVAVSP